MHPSRLLLPLVLLPLLLGATSPTKTSSTLLARATTREFGGSGLPIDTIDMARRNGVDYVKLVNFAAKGDVPSLRKLMRLTIGNFDGAQSEGHAAVLGEMLRHVGDAKFAMALRQESLAIRHAVAGDVLFDTNLTKKGLAKWYPRTSAAVEGKATPTKTAPR